MLKRVEPDHAEIQWFSLAQITRAEHEACVSADHAASCRAMAEWTRSFLMRPHAELGRAGDVCPFTAQAARMDCLRFGSSDAGPGDVTRARRDLLAAFAEFDAIPFPGRLGQFRAVMVAFPRCHEAAGLTMLADTQASAIRASFRRGRMIGLFHAETEAKGLCNPDFRPLRSPVPLIALRALVEQDAAFVLRQPRLAPTYLRHFGLAGLRRLVAMTRGRR